MIFFIGTFLGAGLDVGGPDGGAALRNERGETGPPPELAT